MSGINGFKMFAFCFPCLPKKKRRCLPSFPPIIIKRHGPMRKPSVSRLVCSLNNTPPPPPPHHIRSSSSFKINKVFEDESKGIICYRDDKNGEIICEGYDEGPRLLIHQKFPTFACNPAYITRDSEEEEEEEDQEEIIHLHQRIWLTNVEGAQDLAPGSNDFNST